MKDFFKSIPAIVWVVVSLVAAWLIWFYVVPFIKGMFASASANSDLLSTGETPTLSTADAQSISDAIYNDCSTLWSNDNSDLEAEFGKMNNDADYDLVKKAFGVKNWGFMGFVLAGNGNLSQFLRAFLDAAEITKLNSILTAKGIKNQI